MWRWLRRPIATNGARRSQPASLFESNGHRGYVHCGGLSGALWQSMCVCVCELARAIFSLVFICIMSMCVSICSRKNAQINGVVNAPRVSGGAARTGEKERKRGDAHK